MKNILFLSVILFLSSCNSLYYGAEQPLAQMTFNNVKPFPLYTASYEVASLNRKNPSKLPEGFVADPADIAYDYLNARFNAVGSIGKLHIIIEQATVKHEIVPADQKIANVIGFGKRDHYTVQIIMKLQVYGLSHREVKETTLTANRNIYVSEFASVSDRENIQMQALDSIMDDLDISIRKILKDKYSIL